QALGRAGHQRGDAGRRARLHAVLAPPRIRLGEPDGVHPRLVHGARRPDHLVERLHGELHDADPKRRHQAAAFWTSRSSAVRTLSTCWFTIGCSTRCPIEPTGPAIFTSAAHFISVPPSASSSSNDVVMFIIAPTP